MLIFKILIFMGLKSIQLIWEVMSLPRYDSYCLFTVQTLYSAILDSGTSIMVLPHSLFSSLKEMFLTNYSHLPLAGGLVLDGYYALSAEPSDSWPTLEFQIEGIVLSIPPANYFLKMDGGDQNVWVFGITSMDFDVYIFHLCQLVHFVRRYLHVFFYYCS